MPLIFYIWISNRIEHLVIFFPDQKPIESGQVSRFAAVNRNQAAAENDQDFDIDSGSNEVVTTIENSHPVIRTHPET